MKKLVPEKLFELDIKKMKTFPPEYLKDVEKRAREDWGASPTHADMMRMNGLLDQLFSFQQGKEEELTELGVEIINRYFGDILEGVKLDVKIVDPNDEEKLDMAERAQKKPPKMKPKMPETPMPKKEIDPDAVEKRKIINNVMQGEAQNVHSMIYDAKDQLNEIKPGLADQYMEMLAINKKFDWWDQMNLERSMSENPEMASMVEVQWEPEGDDDDEGGEEGEKEEPKTIPVIKVRALDLPMLIHETVKGIYELIAANALPSQEEGGEEILAQTDTFKDEQQDIRYGPYIAKDIRNYVVNLLENMKGADDIINMHEFVFGKIIMLPDKDFLALVKGMLEKNSKYESYIKGVAKEVIEEIEEWKKSDVENFLGAKAERIERPPRKEDEYEEEEFKDTADEPLSDEPTEEDPADNELINFFNKPKPKPSEDKPEKTGKKKKWVEYGQGELKFMLDKAIDAGDWDLVKEIQPWIKESNGKLFNDMFKLYEEKLRKEK